MTVLMSVASMAPAAWADDVVPFRAGIANFVSHGSTSPDQAKQLSVELRGAALEASYDTMPMRLWQPCDMECARVEGEKLLVDVVVTGVLGFDGETYTLQLDIIPVNGTDVTRRVVEAPRFLALVELARLELHELLAQHRGPAQAPTGRVFVPSTVAPDPYEPSRTATLKPARSRSPMLAFLLELVVPSAGLFYVGDYLGAGLELGGITLGFGVMIATAHSSDPEGFLLGFSLVLGARIYGLITAPISAGRFNRRERERVRTASNPLHLRLRDPSIGLSSPAASYQLALPTIRF